MEQHIIHLVLVDRRKYRAKIRICLHANVASHVGVVGMPKLESQQLKSVNSQCHVISVKSAAARMSFDPRRREAAFRKEIPQSYGAGRVSDVRYLSNEVCSARGLASDPPRIMWSCASVAHTKKQIPKKSVCSE